MGWGGGARAPGALPPPPPPPPPLDPPLSVHCTCISAVANHGTVSCGYNRTRYAKYTHEYLMSSGRGARAPGPPPPPPPLDPPLCRVYVFFYNTSVIQLERITATSAGVFCCYTTTNLRCTASIHNTLVTRPNITALCSLVPRRINNLGTRLCTSRGVRHYPKSRTRFRNHGDFEINFRFLFDFRGFLDFEVISRFRGDFRDFYMISRFPCDFQISD